MTHKTYCKYINIHKTSNVSGISMLWTNNPIKVPEYHHMKKREKNEKKLTLDHFHPLFFKKKLITIS